MEIREDWAVYCCAVTWLLGLVLQFPFYASALTCVVPPLSPNACVPVTSSTAPCSCPSNCLGSSSLVRQAYLAAQA